MSSRIFLKLSFLLLLFTAVGCNLEREVTIDLPSYDTQKIVECYLEPGQPFRLLLSNSNSYFDPLPGQDDIFEFLEEILEKDADVRIRFNGEEIVLSNNLSLDLNTLKIYNYVSDQIVPQDYTSTFDLEILLSDGTTITSSTKILAPIPIDSIALEFDRDSMARTLIYIKDDKSVPRFYRRTLHLVSLDSVPAQDFLADNSIVDNGLLVFGSGFQSNLGEDIINTIYTIDKPYFDYLVSIRSSIAANGNPFAQPGVIFSNVSGTAGALGIFTGLSYDRRVTRVE